MARIRTVKPDFFEDEDVGLLSREARLLFIASWTLADDEGLLRWTVPFIKANVFMYDDDLGSEAVAAAMTELEVRQMVFPYRGGKSQQRLGWIVNFRRHQKINRPQPGRLPAPSLQNPEVVAAYCRRDGWRCGVCGDGIEADPVARTGVLKHQPSVDHLELRSKGGLDYPSNIRIAHQGCNSSRGTDSLTESPDPGATRVNDSLNDSRSERKGMEVEGNGKGMESAADTAEPASQLSTLLADLIAENDPDGKRPTVTQRWLDAERLLLAADGRDPSQAERLIRWCQNNDFWRANVRSMPKFREKYGQLFHQAQRKPKNKHSRVAELVARGQAA